MGICVLHKSIYGLCQAARIWYGVVDEALNKLGFKRLMADQAVWVKTTPEFQCVIGHVDDLLTGGSRQNIDETKAALGKSFKMTDLGPANLFIGLHISRDCSTCLVSLDQAHYTKEIIDLYGFNNCNTVILPLQPGTQLLKTSEDDQLSQHETKLYQAMVGSLGYMINCTRPDLAYAVGKVAQYASNPSHSYMSAVKHIFRYLRGTINTSLCFRGSNGNNKMMAYFDASWADDLNDRRSTYGYTIYMEILLLFGNPRNIKP